MSKAKAPSKSKAQLEGEIKAAVGRGRGQVGIYGLTEGQISERYRTFLREIRLRGGSISALELSRVIGDDPRATTTTLRRMEQDGILIGDPGGEFWHLLTPFHRHTGREYRR